MATKQIERTEYRRPKREDRKAVTLKPGEFLGGDGVVYTNIAVMRVTVTKNQENSGMSILDDLYRAGWEKPESAALLMPSPDGMTFNMVMQHDDMMKDVHANNTMARKMANENDGDLAFVKQSTTDTQLRPLAGMKEDIEAWQAGGGAESDNG